MSFYAYNSLRYGVEAASGDVDGDGYQEVLTGPGPSAAFVSQIRGFDYDGASVSAIAGINTVIFGAGRYGLAVAAGDTDWDGHDEIGCAPGPDASQGSTIAVYDYDGAALAEKPGSRFDAFPGSLGGARLSFCQWWDRDLQRELMVSRGPLPANDSEVVVFDDSSAAFAPLATFDPYPGQTHGATLSPLAAGF